MGVGAGLSMYVVVVQKFTFAISSPDEFLFYSSQLPVIQLTFVENLTPLALRIPEILALQHGVAEHAAKNSPYIWYMWYCAKLASLISV